MDVLTVLAWVVAVLTVSLLAVPVTAWLFPHGDHGAYAVTVGIVTLGVVGHLVGHVAYRLPALLAGLVVLVGASALAYRRVDIVWPRVAGGLAVFLAGFALVLVLRLAAPSAGTNPHWVGEMFLDFGLLASLERASVLPPEDLWFAGESVRYHYGGQLVTSLLAGVSGTPPAVAYNLGLATFFGALVAMAWGVAGSIARPMAISTRWAAAAGAFFVAIAANLETALRLVVWALPGRLAEAAVDAVGVDPSVADWSPGDFFYWHASRVIEREGMVQQTATEFPLFSWLHGDLHAHVLVKPVLLLVVALLVAYWHTPPAARRRRLVVLFGGVAPTIGLVAVMNMWSVPVVVGLVAVALVFAPGHPLDLVRPSTSSRLRSWVRRRWPADDTTSRIVRTVVPDAVRIAVAVAAAAVVTLAAVAWSAPYWHRVVLGGPSESLATWSAPTPVGAFLVVMGAFVVGFGLYLGGALEKTTRPVAVLAGAGSIAIAGVLAGWTVLGVVAGLLAVAWWVLREAASTASAQPEVAGPTPGPETMLIVAGLGIVLLVEVLKLQGDTFNSVFKPYADVWQLWGVALGVVAVRLVDGWPWPAGSTHRPRWSAVATVVVVVLVLSTGVYAALAVPTHLDDGNSWSSATSDIREQQGYTLDATAYIEVLYPEEAEAIRWLDERPGSPTIATAVPAGYWWEPPDGEGAAAPASLTGLSTVLGWSHHQAQYRGGDVVAEREDDIVDLYTGTPEEQAAIVDAYDIEYVYVGPAEQANWVEVTIGDAPGVEAAATFDAVTVYRVADIEG